MGSNRPNLSKVMHLLGFVAILAPADDPHYIGRASSAQKRSGPPSRSPPLARTKIRTEVAKTRTEVSSWDMLVLAWAEGPLTVLLLVMTL
eukprot:6384440-Amphidinium_carterae.1